MIRLAVAELIARRVATALAALGVITAVLGFVLLAETAKTTTALLSGEVARTWRGPYHLLVRPSAAQSDMEARDGLIRPNYFSGLIGGITRDQYQTIRALPGVEVAAPIALVGFVQWPASWVVDLTGTIGGSEPSVVRLSFAGSGEAGLSRYPLGDHYVVATTSGQVQTAPGRNMLHLGSAVIECSQQVHCYSGATLVPPVPQLPQGPGTVLGFALPIVVAGVDPEAEAALAGLSQCVKSGRYLLPSDVPTQVSAPAGLQTTIPVLVSQTSFIDESVQVTIARARDAASLLQGTQPQDLADWEVLEQRSVAAEELYQRFIRSLGSGSFYNVSPLWSPSEVRYEVVDADHLRAQTVPADPTVFVNQLLLATGPELGPIEARDVWFRGLATRAQVRRTELPNSWLRVGEYDPSCLPSFDELAGGGGIDAYSLPRVRTADGGFLGPTRSMAGYVNSPPLILTTLHGAEWFADPSRFAGAPSEAFISAIRVRVAGAEAAGPSAYARLARTAADIHERTGLAVDVVVGSSPKTIQVDLPAGSFGRPSLVVTEGWSVKGVAYTFDRALQVQDLALFAVALFGALALVAQTAFVAVRRRRREFATLRALGWQRHHLTAVVMLEVGGIGLLAGAVALILALPLSVLVAGHISALTLLVVPLALLVSIAGGVLPAIAVTRATVAKTLFAAGAHPRGRMPDLPWQIGLMEVLRRQGREPLVAISVIALAGTLVGAVIAIAIGFRGQLDITVLGTYVASRVLPFHAIIAALTLVIGALAAGQIVTLGYLERQPELATLRAAGWRASDVVAYVAGGALAVCGIGGVVAAALVLLLTVALGAAPGAIALAVGAALLSPVLAVLLAVTGTLLHAYRLSPAQALRGE